MLHGRGCSFLLNSDFAAVFFFLNPGHWRKHENKAYHFYREYEAEENTKLRIDESTANLEHHCAAHGIVLDGKLNPNFPPDK